MPTPPDYVFVLNPPGSGSTAFASTLMTSPAVDALTPTAEAYSHPYTHHLVAERWRLEKAIDWNGVRRDWLRAWDERTTKPHARIMLEKSPPNVIRAAGIAAAFPGSSFIIWNRDPYAVAASLRRRHGHTIESSTRLWLGCARANLVNRMRLDRSLALTYEQFSAEPQASVARLMAFIPALAGLDLVAEHRIKDYQPSRWRNLNPEQIALLSAADVEAANEVLRPAPEAMEAYGYTLRSPDDHPRDVL